MLRSEEANHDGAGVRSCSAATARGKEPRANDGKMVRTWIGTPRHVVSPSSARQRMEVGPHHPSVSAVLHSIALAGCIHNRSGSSAVLPKTPCREGVVHT